MFSFAFIWLMLILATEVSAATENIRIVEFISLAQDVYEVYDQLKIMDKTFKNSMHQNMPEVELLVEFFKDNFNKYSDKYQPWECVCLYDIFINTNVVGKIKLLQLLKESDHWRKQYETYKKSVSGCQALKEKLPKDDKMSIACDNHIATKRLKLTDTGAMIRELLFTLRPLWLQATSCISM